MPASTTLSGYERHADDWYVEPREATQALLLNEWFYGTMLDPACGEGRIVEECQRAGLSCSGMDIKWRGEIDKPPTWYLRSSDFLGGGETGYFSFDSIITNPPFKLLTPFIERALEMARWKVAIFCKLQSLEGITRLNKVYRKYPLARVHVFADRQSCPPGGEGIKNTGTKLAYCWQVYEHGHKGPPTLHWLNTKELGE